jgi:hypothetical protein
MSPIVTHTDHAFDLLVGDRVRYVDFPPDRRGVSRVNRHRTREGRVLELIDAVYGPPDAGGMCWLREPEIAVVEFDDGTIGSVVQWSFLLALNADRRGREGIQLLTVLQHNTNTP